MQTNCKAKTAAEVLAHRKGYDRATLARALRFAGLETSAWRAYRILRDETVPTDPERRAIAALLGVNPADITKKEIRS